MYKIPGCKINAKIFESPNTLIYRGTQQPDERPIVLKILKEDYPSPEELVRYRQEFEITQNLELSGVIKAYGQEKYGNTLAIILEDFGGESLKALSQKGPFTPEQVLKLAIQISKSLRDIHKAQVIHKDLNPSNILYNPNSGQLKLIDFGISTKLSRELPELQNPERLEGTLAYMSPEQTGRMNRVVDYRTDFYALGATLYELFTGSLPFTTTDPLELTHCHLAREPESPRRFNPEISENLSSVILKLLAKRAEDRYQTSRGLIADLEFCLGELVRKSNDPSFKPGVRDVAETFQLPQKLYGRESELATLLNTAKRAAAGRSQALFVAGYSGVGKSALIKELYGTLIRPGGGTGYFITGKFDQYHRNIPYSAAQEALRDLIRQLLTENELRLSQWKEDILDALGPNGRLLTEFLPELELIIGEQPPVPELDSAANRNRFTLELRKFVSVFLRSEQPLVFFLDDLQWADLASLTLIQLITTDTRHLFFLGAYRDNEVAPGHPLLLTQDEMRKANIPLETITLAPLGLKDIRRYIADAACRDPNDTEELANLIKQKTNGNPFFLGEFLKTMEQGGLLSFHDSRGVWTWDMKELQEQNITDNVVELIADRVREFSGDTRAALTRAACLGNTFDLETLALLHGKSPAETAGDLWPALELNMLLPLRDDYKVAALKPLDIPVPENRFIYRFAHDRIEEAGYNLIPEQERKTLHLKVGRLLLGESSRDVPVIQVFAIVDHLNMGRELITVQAERDVLARLNLQAGYRAQASTAYEAALSYFKTGLELLNDKELNSWRREYDLTLALSNAGAEAALLSNNYVEMETFSKEILEWAANNLDRVKVYELQIQSFAARNNPFQGIETAAFILKKLGINSPKKPGVLHVLTGLLLTKLRLAGKSPEYILNLPEMKSPNTQAASRILDKIAGTAYTSAPEMLALFTFQQLKLSLKYGNAQETAVFYAVYGLMLFRVLGDVENAYKYGNIALNLMEHLNIVQNRAKIIFTYNFFIRHWKEPLRNSVKPLLDTHKLAMETGDLEIAAWSIHCTSVCALWSGSELGELESKVKARLQIITKIGQTRVFNYLAMTLQGIQQFMEITPDPSNLEGEAYSEENTLQIHIDTNDKTSLFLLYFFKMILSYHFKESFHNLLHNANESEKYAHTAPGSQYFSVFHFYDSLVRLSLYASASRVERKRIRKKVKANQKKLKHWARFAPMNQLHRFYLVTAEEARVLGKDEKARKFYELAIDLARKNDYLNDEALAWELGGRFYLENDLLRFGHFYMTNAHYTYSRWGAQAKVAYLEKSFPDIFETQTALSKEGTTLSISDNSPASSLDLAAIVKASQAIAGEIHTEVLIEKLMSIVLENTGAEEGTLILARGGQYFIKARAGARVELLDFLPLDAEIEGRPLLPHSLIAYVIRTREALMLDEAGKHELFQNDPYIQERQSQSLICTPILHQQNLTGLLYLENNVLPGVFTPDRLEILRLLSAQIAVSLKNALDYEELQNANKTKGLFLSKMSHELRTPLTGILGQGQILLQKDASREEVIERVGNIVANGEKLNTFITNILELTRMEQRDPGAISNFNPAVFFENLLLPFRTRATTQGISFKEQVSINLLPQELRADREGLDRLLHNLLDNAFKFTKVGSVTLRTTYEEGTLHCEIEDTGPGLTPAQQKSIFSPFLRAKENTLNTGEGTEITGLGLAVSKLFVDNLSGSLSIRSEPEQGSVFIVEIPMEATIPARAEEMERSRPAPDVEPENISGPLSEEAQELYKLSKNGDLMGIIEYAEQLERRNPELKLFCRELTRLAKGFQERKLSEFIGKYTD